MPRGRPAKDAVGQGGSANIHEETLEDVWLLYLCAPLQLSTPVAVRDLAEVNVVPS